MSCGLAVVSAIFMFVSTEETLGRVIFSKAKIHLPDLQADVN